MNRRKITLLSVTAAGLLAIVLMGSVWFTYFSDKSAGFHLPPHLSPGSTEILTPGPGPGGPEHSLLTVDALNIQLLLTTVDRPVSYSQTIECVWYWPGGEGYSSHLWVQRGSLIRVETRKDNSPVQNRILLDGDMYIWIGDSVVYHKYSPGDTDAEALAGIPTWETVTELPPESVLFAESLILAGERCLRVLTGDDLYRREYIVSLETGLLVRAAYTGADGQLAYECNAGPPVLGDPGDIWFTLPDEDKSLLD